LPKSATNRQQSRLLPYTFNFVADTFNIVAGFGNKSATARIRQLVAVDFVADTFDSAADTVDFVASVYGAKATRSIKHSNQSRTVFKG